MGQRHIYLLGDKEGRRLLMHLPTQVDRATSPRRARGMTLVELMIGLAVLAFVLMSGAPAFADWIRNLQVRSTSESILSGIQYARTEAVRRNTTTRFQLTSSLTNQCTLSTSGLSWVVTLEKDNTPAGKCGEPLSDTTAPKILQQQNASTNASLISVKLSRTGSTLIPSLAFNSLGQQIQVDGVDPAVLTTIDIKSPQGSCATSNGTGGTVRCMRIEVTRGGQIRLCDPGLADTANTRSMACLTR